MRELPFGKEERFYQTAQSRQGTLIANWPPLCFYNVLTGLKKASTVPLLAHPTVRLVRTGSAFQTPRLGAIC